MFSSLWKRILAGCLLILTLAGVYFREEIVFNARLMNVVRVGRAYYEEYPYLTKNSSCCYYKHLASSGSQFRFS